MSCLGLSQAHLPTQAKIESSHNDKQLAITKQLLMGHNTNICFMLFLEYFHELYALLFICFI